MTVRGLILASAALIALATPAFAAEREVTVDGGVAPLYGTLEDAGGKTKGPAVLLIAGSGPTDRDGNSTVPGVGPATLKLLAQAFAAEGIPSLRYDKRAIAKSAPAGLKEQDLRFTTGVDDAVAFGKLLAKQPGVTCVVIAGHSEGATIASMAAQKMPVCGVIELAGAGRSVGVVLREQLRAQLPPALLIRAETGLSEMESGKITANIPGLESVFRPSVQPYLISALAIDPAKELRAVKAPVLIVQGENDLQISVADARLLAQARPDARLEIVPGVNHVLKAAPAERAANIATYADPALPIPPSILRPVIAFVKAAKP